MKLHFCKHQPHRHQTHIDIRFLCNLPRTSNSIQIRSLDTSHHACMGRQCTVREQFRTACRRCRWGKHRNSLGRDQYKRHHFGMVFAHHKFPVLSRIVHQSILLHIRIRMIQLDPYKLHHSNMVNFRNRQCWSRTHFLNIHHGTYKRICYPNPRIVQFPLDCKGRSGIHRFQPHIEVRRNPVCTCIQIRQAHQRRWLRSGMDCFRSHR